MGSFAEVGRVDSTANLPVNLQQCPNFCDFYKLFPLQSRWSRNFFELADNGFLGCIAVVGANARKLGRLGVLRAGLGAL